MHGQDEREFQIALANIQMKHKTKRSTFFAIMVFEFLILWILGNYLSKVQYAWLLAVTLGMIVIGAFTVLLFLWDLHDLEREVSALKQKYTW